MKFANAPYSYLLPAYPSFSYEIGKENIYLGQLLLYIPACIEHIHSYHLHLHLIQTTTKSRTLF